MQEVVLIKGDGIGPEISDAVVSILDAAGAGITWVERHAGLSCVDTHPNCLPDETLDAVRTYKVALKGPTTTPVGTGHKSVNVTLRKTLELYANVRPARSLPGISTRFSDVDLLIVRENIEDTYGGIEHMQTYDVAQCLKLITRPGSMRIARYAFELAVKLGRKKVTCVHKANIMKLTDGLFLECFREVAKDYPQIESNDIIVDNCCMQMVIKPEQFDVLVLPNLAGDIVSDLSAGLVGGLGVAPGGNIGDELAVFEAVHGSAPDIAGKNMANPTALLLSAIQMLQHLGKVQTGKRVQDALLAALADGIKTRDLGGSASTTEFAEAIISRLAPADGIEEASPIRIEAGAVKDVNAAEKRCIGADIFVEWASGVPPMPEQVGNLRLVMMSNRGTKMYPGPVPPEMHLVDHYRCRYRHVESDGGAAAGDADILAVLSALQEKGISWMHIEKLHMFGSTPGFTRAQGE